MNAGADDYLDVPFRNEELLVKVARLAERRRVEKHYRDIVEDAADIIYTRDIDGYITSMNAAGVRFFGKSSEEIVGAHLSKLIGDEAAKRDIEETLKAAIGSPLRSTYCWQDANQNGRYLEGVITIQRDRQGKPTGIRGVIRDITDQKLAEGALRQAEAQLRMVVGNASLVIFSLDKNGIFTLSEGEGLTALGLKPGEVVGQSVFEIYRDNPAVLESVRRALAGEAFTQAVDVGDLYFETRYTPHLDEANNVVGIIGVATDITRTVRRKKHCRKMKSATRAV